MYNRKKFTHVVGGVEERTLCEDYRTVHRIYSSILHGAGLHVAGGINANGREKGWRIAISPARFWLKVYADLKGLAKCRLSLCKRRVCAVFSVGEPFYLHLGFEPLSVYTRDASLPYDIKFSRISFCHGADYCLS